MKFGAVPLADAEGAILAHSVQLPGGGRIRKGQVLHAEDMARLQAADLSEVIVARLEAGDVGEDDAARILAEALVPDPRAVGLSLDRAFTGRVNIRATGPGVVALDAEAIAALNRVDPAITLATVPRWQRVTDGTMVGTVKIIAYGVDGGALDRACGHARGALSRVAPVMRTADLIVTETAPTQSATDEDKGVRAVRHRLEALGLSLASVRQVPHRSDAVSAALADCVSDMALILTGSATSDPDDVAPAGIRAAGGDVLRFGMPVDPGNLLVLARIGARPVIGLPGCARSPALNGADWVLERLACGIEVTGDDIAAMGVGGLLKEIPTRPQPRDGPRRR